MERTTKPCCRAAAGYLPHTLFYLEFHDDPFKEHRCLFATRYQRLWAIFV